MSLRYLFGPVAGAFADQNLREARQAGDCLAFNATGAGVDLALGPTATWADLLARLPKGWRPNFVALWLPYATVAPALWAAPVPLVGLAPDWNLLWHHYRRCLRRCELVLTDAPGVDVLAREGIDHAAPANLFGCELAFLDAHAHAHAGPRDLDVLFVGNLSPSVQRQRQPWLARLARLGPRRRVAIRTGAFGDDYRKLLSRARIVFNQSVRGEWNRRVGEAISQGCLLFQEWTNREVPPVLRDRRECVLYDDDNLEELIEHYLAREDERRAIADAARARLAEFSFAALWGKALRRIEAGWADLGERAARRPVPDEVDGLLGRAWQAACANDEGDPLLPLDLSSALVRHPSAAALHLALGVASTRAAQGDGPAPALAAHRAAGHFHQALRADAAQPVAALDLAEALVALHQGEPAANVARAALARLDRGPAPSREALDAAHYPLAYDLFRVEWERAAWAHPGKPASEARAKLDLLHWRLHVLLADLTGDLAHYQEAAQLRPDFSVSHAALGCGLARAGRVREALPHLRKAIADGPFDLEAARALHQALAAVGDADAAARLVEDRRLLSRAAPQAVPSEAWFALPAPSGRELASLVVLCCNEVECTRLCLESVLRHTRAPYELVLIDNGSTDGTADYFKELRDRRGPARVEVVTNERNLGFPAGCNQGLARAQGRYVVFLNNDTVVTPGWLDGLVAWARHDWAAVGMVGAVTNYASPPQQVEVDYDLASLDGLDDFAARRRANLGGQALEFSRLTGFCLLARREVLEEVGGFDERYGLGFFDDDDLCLRVRQAGYRLVVALDAFVHHFGSRTFAALGVDTTKQLAENFARFKDKWGPEHAAPYRAPGGAPMAKPAPREGEALAEPGEEARQEPRPPGAALPLLAQPAVGRMTRSLSTIVKNEAHNLPACLASVAGLFDEVVVVDTGSTDDTKQIAADLGARVFDFAWCDDFSAARNEALRHCTGDWVFWMDADDRLDEENRARLLALLDGLKDENVAYGLKCRCLPNEEGVVTVVDHVRLFRNRPEMRWEYRVHEQILPSVRARGGEVRQVEVFVQHTGYQDRAVRERKLARDRRLLELEGAERPADPFTLFNLGNALMDAGRVGEALPHFRRSLELSDPGASIVRKLYAQVFRCHRALGQPAEALAVAREGLRVCPDDVELLFLQALLLQEEGGLPAAEACLRRLLAARPAPHFASLDEGIRTYLPRSNLADLCLKQGRHDEAATLWREVLGLRPDFRPAWLGLAEVALVRRQWDDLEEAAAQLDAARASLEASVMRARGHQARGELGPARSLLEAAIGNFPGALWPRRALVGVLLQEGKDAAATESALRSVLALDPQCPETRTHLAGLLARQQARDEAFVGPVGLGQLYHQACSTPSDVNEHLPTLHALAKECRHVTELGTRAGTSTTALLYAQPEVLVCYDRVKYAQVDRLRALAGRTDFTFHAKDVLWVEIEETDLLFIDTWHVYDQLSQELALHARKARKYVVLHDTTTFGEVGEDQGHRGLWPAVEELLARGEFRVKARYENNNGLTVLERLAARPGKEVAA